MPDESEVQGLLALMLLHNARRAARFRGDDLVLLDDQDRKLWDTAQIAEGRLVLNGALALHGLGPLRCAGGDSLVAHRHCGIGPDRHPLRCTVLRPLVELALL